MTVSIDAVTIIAPPFWYKTHWGTIPPAGYGGIEWSIVNLMDGLLALDVRVALLGAPDSRWPDPRVHVVDAADDEDIIAWLKKNEPAVVHDFANFSTFHESIPPASAYCRTWAMTSQPPGNSDTVYVSEAQRLSMADPAGVSIPLSVNPDRYRYREEKEDYFLFLGKIADWKGVYEAAALTAHVDGKLVVAGPGKDLGYRDRIVRDFGHVVEFAGEVGGEERIGLLARARAQFVLSQPVQGPWGQIWCEPGATVVSEAAASGTPVVATPNGCLPSLIPGVGALVPTGAQFTDEDAERVLALPSPGDVRDTAVRRWGHVRIAREYLEHYRDCLASARGAGGDQ